MKKQEPVTRTMANAINAINDKVKYAGKTLCKVCAVKNIILTSSICVGIVIQSNYQRQPKNMQQIKKTKGVEMYGNKDGVFVKMSFGNREVWIPVSKVFQVKRGLESYVQRFYRKQTK